MVSINRRGLTQNLNGLANSPSEGLLLPSYESHPVVATCVEEKTSEVKFARLCKFCANPDAYLETVDSNLWPCTETDILTRALIHPSSCDK